MQGTLDRCPEFNTKSNLMVILSLSLIHFLQIPSLGTKWDELLWFWSIVQLLWSVTKSPICFPYWSRAYFFICTMPCLRESGQIPWIFIHYELLWMPSPNEVLAISLYFPSLYLVFGQFPQGTVAMLCGYLPWQSLPQFWIFIQCAISRNSNAF